MTTNNNSSNRVYNILFEAQKKPDNHKIIDVWTAIFSIKEEDQHKKSFEVSRCLGLLHEEMNNIEESMAELGYSNDLYAPYISRARHVIALHGIMGQWKTLKSNLAPEVLLSLKFCSEILPNEEETLNKEKLEEILNMVLELEAELDSTDLPQQLKNIIIKSIKQIKEAIYSYNIVGVKAVHEVISNAYGDVVLNEAEFVKAKENKIVIKISQVWRKTIEISNDVVKLEKGAKAGKNIVAYGQKAFDIFNNIFPAS